MLKFKVRSWTCLGFPLFLVGLRSASHSICCGRQLRTSPGRRTNLNYSKLDRLCYLRSVIKISQLSFPTDPQSTALTPWGTHSYLKLSVALPHSPASFKLFSFFQTACLTFLLKVVFYNYGWGSS